MPQSAAQEFFEKRIRPVLVDQCYRCHNSHETSKGGLALDSRSALRRGGDSGPAIVLGKPSESLLIRALRHEAEDLRMPEESAKLSERVIADFEAWIERGATDPRDDAPSAEQLTAILSWDSIRRRRMDWWSFRPVSNPRLPRVERDGWSSNPIDRFILARLEQEGLEPAARADRITLIRRVTFALTGLPPTPDEVAAFVANESPASYETLVDRLLASPRYGERWARHWMDWMRYAETHGSEGDPVIPHAWRYRDYLIRALNRDVGFDQLILEHIAGDLLPEPRIDRDRAVNESILGIAQLRMVQHGFAPTDALDEQVRFTDNQIDVLTKGFLGLTVSCARCHDHKFDPISQEDFYALFGILASCRPALVTIDTPDIRARNKDALATLKSEIKRLLAVSWSKSIGDLVARLSDDKDEAVIGLLEAAAKDSKSPLHAWARMRTTSADAFPATWRTLVAAWEESRKKLSERRAQGYPGGWDLRGADYQEFFARGNGLGHAPSKAGEFHIQREGDRVLTAILPAGVYTHLLSQKHNGVLDSPRFEFDMKSIYLRVIGGGGAKARYVVHNYPRGGTVYPIAKLNKGKYRWVKWDTSYWRGDQGHLEVSTAADLAVEANTGTSHSWFGVSEAVFVSDEQAKRGDVPRDHSAEFTTPLFTAAALDIPTSDVSLASLYRVSLESCIAAWNRDELTDTEARFLSYFVRNDLLPTRLEKLPAIAELVQSYRDREAAIPIPRRAPGIIEADAFDQPLFIRGDHKDPGHTVKRRFLAAIGNGDYQTNDSGRLELARDFVRADNPLTARVAVNRLWHHLFGRGIAATTDNFGRLGELPTHPALLDHLARHMVESKWSIKTLLRAMVTSETYCANSHASVEALVIDPDNRLLSRFRVKRLEAEAIRDSLLAVSGDLDTKMFGRSVGSTSRRRSVYVQVHRNRLDPFLAVFDAPEPHTTRGRRDETNVPSQSLTLLNDPFVIDLAQTFASTVVRDLRLDDDSQIIRRLFTLALSREPKTTEIERSLDYLAELSRRDRDIQATVARLESQLTATEAQLSNLTKPIQQRLLDALGDAAVVNTGPEPIANWEFEGDLRDSVGSLHGKAHGSAVIADGALVLDGKSHVETEALGRDLREKTLEVWVALKDLDQSGGGVISVETIGGQVFDSIVFGERDPRQWISGSNNFKRTEGLAGPDEATTTTPIHLTITYDSDGSITTYRDGVAYGKSYISPGPVTFAAGQSVVLFGLRHSPANSGKRLRGRLFSARLYDRALTAEEVAANARGDHHFVTTTQVVAAMSAAQRRAHTQLKDQIERLQHTRAELEEPAGYAADRQLLWRDFAQSLFNLKEFIYLK